MPGMMDTVLNLGLTDASLPGFAKKYGQRFANDCYRHVWTHTHTTRLLDARQMSGREPVCITDLSTVCVVCMCTRNVHGHQQKSGQRCTFLTMLRLRSSVGLLPSCIVLSLCVCLCVCLT